MTGPRLSGMPLTADAAPLSQLGSTGCSNAPGEVCLVGYRALGTNLCAAERDRVDGQVAAEGPARSANCFHVVGPLDSFDYALHTYSPALRADGLPMLQARTTWRE